MATLTLRNVDDGLLDTLKEFTGQSVASKALIGAAAHALTLSDDLKKAHQMLDQVSEALEVRNQLLRQLTPLCVQVAELAGQGDLYV